MAQSQANVLKLYRSVIDDVISGVREAFLDEGVDEQILQELRQIWETKLVSSKAVELNPDPPEPQPPQLLLQKDSLRNSMMTKPVQQLYAPSQQTTLGVGHMHQTGPVMQQANHQQHLPQQSQSHLGMAQQQQHQQMQQHHHQQQHQQQQQQVPQPQQGQQPSQQTVIVADPNKLVPIQIALPAQGGVEPRVLTIQVPASALQGNQIHSVLTGPVISATMALPPQVACSLLQHHVTAALQGQATSLRPQVDGAAVISDEDEDDDDDDDFSAAMALPPQIASLLQRHSTAALQRQAMSLRPQVDGAADTSDEDEDDDEDEDIDDDDENDEKDEEENEEEANEGAEEEPLNSGDDVSDEDPSDLFDTDNVVVCQYDKITRSRNKWKFYLKDGIMNLNSKDFVFQRASGDAEW